MAPSILKSPTYVPAGACACEVASAGSVGAQDKSCGVLDLPRDQLLAVVELRMRDGLPAGEALAATHVAKLEAARRARTTTLAASPAQPDTERQDSMTTFGDLELKAAKAQRKADRKRARADARGATDSEAESKAARAESKAIRTRVALNRARHDAAVAGRSADPNDVASRPAATAQPSRKFTGSGAASDQPEYLSAQAEEMAASARRAAALLSQGGNGLRKGPNGTVISARDFNAAQAVQTADRADTSARLDDEDQATARLRQRSAAAHMQPGRMTRDAALAELAGQNPSRAAHADGRTAGAAGHDDDEESAAAARMRERSRAASSTPTARGVRK